MTTRSLKNCTCRKCEGNIGEAVEQEEKLCDEMESVREFMYLGDAGGGCEAVVTVRIRYGFVKFMVCSELLYGRRVSLRFNGAVYKSYVMAAILYGSETWCLEHSEMGILRRTEKSMVRAMCEVQLKDRIRPKDLMLGLNGSMDQLTMANSVHWYGHVLRMALDFEVESQRKKGRLKRTWKELVDEESVKVGLRREDTLCQ